MSVRVATATESAAIDAGAISAGIPGRALMQRAASAAAAEITIRLRDRLSAGVHIFAGPGNNGGDGWAIGAALHAVGVPVSVEETAEARTADAIAERAHARALVATGRRPRTPGIVVDAVLGTGAAGAPRGAAATAVAEISRMRDAGAAVVSVDLPTGVDATTGAADGAVVADLTVTFGTMKRGALVARAHCGRIVVVDIGLGRHADVAALPVMMDARTALEQIPGIAADAHKGTRRRIGVVGGTRGMAGAAVLAARAALRSGAGLVRLVVDADSLAAAQSGVPAALASDWPADAESARSLDEWADCLIVGPGIGREAGAGVAERVLAAGRTATVLDADALNAFAGRTDALRDALGGRPAVLTPHPMELARLLGRELPAILEARFDVALEAARAVGCVVLLKGVPTVVAHPDGRRFVSASGTPALATGGSGDVLGGIVATLLAQTGDPLHAAACGAWVHGRAAEIATPPDGSRGVTLDDIVDSLARAWDIEVPAPRVPVLLELPPIGLVRSDGGLQR